jgi:hypothetical protein
VSLIRSPKSRAISKRVLIDKTSRANPHKNDCTEGSFVILGQTLKDHVNASECHCSLILLINIVILSLIYQQTSKYCPGRGYILGLKYCDRIPVGTSAIYQSPSLIQSNETLSKLKALEAFQKSSVNQIRTQDKFKLRLLQTSLTLSQDGRDQAASGPVV